MAGLPELGRDVAESLSAAFGELLEGASIFGSMSRGEGGERSDVDVFVVLRDGPSDPVDRRRMVYLALAPVRARYRRDTTVVDLLAGDAKGITPLLLNVAADSIIVFDRKGWLATLFSRILKAAEEAGLERRRTKSGTYAWVPKRLSLGERLELKL